MDPTSKRGQILKKKCFSPQSEPYTAKLCFSFVFKNFWGNSQRTSIFRPKNDYLRKEHWIVRKFVFLNMFEKGKIRWKIWSCLNNFFYLTSKRGQILTKTVFFLPKMSHIQLNYAFLLFLSIFGGIHRELLFFVKEWLSQKRALK